MIQQYIPHNTIRLWLIVAIRYQFHTFSYFRAASPMGGPNGATSTENMNGDAKPTNSKVRKSH